MGGRGLERAGRGGKVLGHEGAPESIERARGQAAHATVSFDFLRRPPLGRAPKPSTHQRAARAGSHLTPGRARANTGAARHELPAPGAGAALSTGPISGGGLGRTSRLGRGANPDRRPPLEPEQPTGASRPRRRCRAEIALRAGRVSRDAAPAKRLSAAHSW